MPRNLALAVASGATAIGDRERPGRGMSPEELARAGEPFFTTKPPGAGHGPRSVCHALGDRAARWHPDDRLDARAHGTTVTMRLPRDVIAPRPDVDDVTRPLLLHRGRRRRAAAALARAFDERGFDVRQAATIQEAEAIVADEDARVRRRSTCGCRRTRSRSDSDAQGQPTRQRASWCSPAIGSIATALEAVRRGATHYLTKPADADEILAAFDRGVDSDVRAAPCASCSRCRSIASSGSTSIACCVDCQGNVSEAARVLGLHRRSLQRKLSKHPLRR